MAIENPTVITNSGEGTLATVSVPSSVEGDRQIAAIICPGGTNIVVTPPTGWALVNRQDYLTNLALVTYQKTALASEPASYSWALSSSQKWVSVIANYPGAEVITNIVARSDEYSVRDFLTEEITTAGGNSRVVAIVAQKAPTIWTPPGGWTLQGSGRSGASAKAGDVSLALLDTPKAIPGLEPVVTLTAQVAGSCFYFQRNAGLFPSDTVLKGYLTDLGFTIVIGDQDSATALADANAADMVFVSPSVFSSRPENIQTTNTPFLLSKGFASDNVGMAGPTANVDFGINETPFATSFEIVDSGHPISAGLSGAVQPYTSDPVSPAGRAVWSNPHNLIGAALAFKETLATRYYQYGFEPGYVFIDGVTTKSVRWSYTFVDQNDQFSANGEALLKAVMDWTVRATPSAQLIIEFELAVATEGAIAFSPIAVSGVSAELVEGIGAIAFSPIAVAGVGAELVDGVGAIAFSPIAIAGREDRLTTPASDRVFNVAGREMLEVAKVDRIFAVRQQIRIQND